ncbi:hypothetical protein A2U01_0055444 [Trifolium medium]|uniref:Uncharacterized protein n=1 Tax=Trifolium medium TaxID=97028 RepID=A0A392REG7_9FABA|nr:hypothetical protein [Trifolium medium]
MPSECLDSINRGHFSNSSSLRERRLLGVIPLSLGQHFTDRLVRLGRLPGMFPLSFGQLCSDKLVRQGNSIDVSPISSHSSHCGIFTNCKVSKDENG